MIHGMIHCMIHGMTFGSGFRVWGSRFGARSFCLGGFWIEHTELVTILGCVVICFLWCADWARRRAVLGDRDAPWAVAYKSVFSRSLDFGGGGSTWRKVGSTCTALCSPHSSIKAHTRSHTVLEFDQPCSAKSAAWQRRRPTHALSLTRYVRRSSASASRSQEIVRQG